MPDIETIGRASVGVEATPDLTARSPDAGRATSWLDAFPPLTAPRIPPEVIGQIQLAYRLAKAAELSRSMIDLRLYAFARTHLTGWQPDAEPLSRSKAAAAARRVVEAVRKGQEPAEAEREAYAGIADLVIAAEPSRQAFEAERKRHRRNAERLVMGLPAWGRLQHIRGFSAWGLTAIVGEAGDLGAYSGCRKLFKRLGLAPDECYPTGEKRTGRKIPRSARGRIMGIIADPLLRAQWRGAREDDGGSQSAHESRGQGDPAVIPAHAIGPYGAVYGEAKARHLAAGKVKGHADKAARRAMVKALLHDVHAAWHGRDLMYAAVEEAA